LLLYSSKPSLGVFQLAGHLLQANKLSGTIKHNQVFWHHHHRAITRSYLILPSVVVAIAVSLPLPACFVDFW
jgi:hypothetical protein